MKLRRETGYGLADDWDHDRLVKESRAHFELLCERFPNSPWIEFRVSTDTNEVTVAVGED